MQIMNVSNSRRVLKQFFNLSESLGAGSSLHNQEIAVLDDRKCGKNHNNREHISRYRVEIVPVIPLRDMRPLIGSEKIDKQRGYKQAYTLNHVG